MKKILLTVSFCLIFVPTLYSAPKDFMGMKKGQVEFQSINIFDATVIYPYPTWFKS